MKKLYGLEVVRALAALTVVAGHIFYFNLISAPVAIKMITAFSTEAVIVFFILSGLVITKSAHLSQPTPLIFLWQRLVRIYPIYIFAIGLAVITHYIIKDRSYSSLDLIGNFLFLQSLGGYITSPPSTNPPLWSLANEMTYYAIFSVCLWRPKLAAVSWILAIGGAIAATMYSQKGALGHLIQIFSLALPWLFGSSIARNFDKLPKVSVPLGVCLLIIGLLFTRSPISDNFYDPFRLCAFGLLSSPLMLALATPQENPTVADGIIRPIAFSIGAALLWTISPAILITKAGLTIVGFLAAFVPLRAIEIVLFRMSVLRKPLVYVGTISYALYAIHVPVLLLVRHFTPEIALLRLVVFLPTTLFLSHFLERRLQPQLAKALSPKRVMNDVENREHLKIEAQGS